jgi:large subunit ribosomal protein L15
MPLQRRLPKTGFTSHKKSFSVEVRLSELARLPLPFAVSLEGLKAANLIPKTAKHVKIIDSGIISVPVAVSGLKVTPGAKAKIEAAGGKIEV